MNRKWKQRPSVGKGKERRKGRGWGAAPISSAPDRSGRPGGFPRVPPGAAAPASPSAGLGARRVRPPATAQSGERGVRRTPSSGRRTPLPQPAPHPAPRGPARARTFLPGIRPAQPRPSAAGPPILNPPRPLLCLLLGPDPSSPQAICHRVVWASFPTPERAPGVT